MKKRFVARICLLCGGLLVGWHSANALLKLGITHGYVLPSFEYKGFRISLDRERLYRLQPSCRPDVNRAGFRDDEFSHEKSGLRLVFLGDSFLMGANVAADETLPRFLEKELQPDAEVLNMGILGYGPDQSLVVLREEGLAYHPDIVLLQVFPTNDFHDLYKNQLMTIGPNGRAIRTERNLVEQALARLEIRDLYRSIRSEHGAWETSMRPLLNALFGDGSDLTFMLGLSPVMAAQKERLMAAVLAEYKRELDARGIWFGVVIIPSYESIRNEDWLQAAGVPQYRYFANEELMASVCKALSIPYLPLHAMFRELESTDGLFDEEDHHFAPRGNRVAATMVKNFLTEQAPAVADASFRRRFD